MKDNTANKNVLRAISIGLAAMMAIQPVMTKTAFADDNVDEGAKSENRESSDNHEENKNEGQACEISSASSDLGEIRSEASEAKDFTDYNKGHCEDAINFAVSAGRDATAENDIKYDKDRGQALNAMEQAVLGTDIMKAEVQDTELIMADRQAFIEDANKLVEDTKRGYTNIKKLDAYELLDGEKTVLNKSDLTNAANAVDDAIKNYSKELEDLNDAVDVDAALAGIEGTINLKTASFEDVATIPEADELLGNAGGDLEKAEDIYNNALALYNEKEAKHDEAMKKVEGLQRNYDKLLEAQLADSSKLMKAKAELELAMDDLNAFEEDVVTAKENLANTVIGKMAAAFDKEEKTDDDLDLIFEDVLKYYYFPGLSDDEKVESSNIRIGEKDGEYFNIEILSEDGSVVETKQYKFAYDAGAMTIFEKDGEVDVAEHYVDSDGNKIDESDAKNLFEITTAKEGLVVRDNGEAKYYQVNDDGEVVVPDDGTYSFDENDVTTEYTIEDGKLVETKIAGEATTTVIRTATLDAAEKTYDSFDEANNGENDILDSLGTNGKSEGKKVSAVINVEEDATFSTTIDLSQFEKNDNNGKKEQLVDYIKDVFEGGDVSRDGDQVTFTYTVKKGVYENENAESEFSLIDTFDWSGFSNKLTSGGAKVDNLLEALRNGSDSSTPSVSYKLTLSGVSYDEETTETVKNQVISQTNFGLEALERIEETRKDKEVANSAQAEADAKKVDALDKQYDATMGYITKAKEEVGVAQGHVQDVIDAINKARENLKDRISWLNGQMDAAKDKIDDAADQMDDVKDAYDEAEDAHDKAIERLKPKPVVTPTEDTEESEETEETEESEETAPEEETGKTEETAPEEETGKTEETAPEEETEKTEETTPKEETEKSEETAPEEETGKTEETAPEEETGKTEETAPEEETGKTEETAPEEETEKSEETAPEEETGKTEETAPTEETKKPGKTTPTKESEKSGDTTPASVTPSTPVYVAVPSPVAEAPVVSVPTGETVATPASGVAGVRHEMVTGSGTQDEVNGELPVVADAIEMDQFEDKIEEKAGEKIEDKKIETIEDEATPLASFDEESAKKMNWWWLLIIALLGATGEEMYRRHKNKKEAALAAENKKDSDK